MSKHNDCTSVGQMLDHAREAVDMLRDRSLKDLDENRMLELALVRLVEIIGEAAYRVSEEGRENHLPERGHSCPRQDPLAGWKTRPPVTVTVAVS
jgi:uncharacterized protein with HEPN domain